MFKILENITKAAVGVAILPIAIVSDVVTLGGAMTEKEGTYTGERLRDIKDNLDKAVKPNDGQN